MVRTFFTSSFIGFPSLSSGAPVCFTSFLHDLPNRSQEFSYNINQVLHFLIQGGWGRRETERERKVVNYDVQALVIVRIILIFIVSEDTF